MREFVEAVEKATKEPFNVIIPESAQDLVIPPVPVREVTLPPAERALGNQRGTEGGPTGKNSVMEIRGRAGDTPI